MDHEKQEMDEWTEEEGFGEEESFEKLLEESFVAPRKLTPGEKISARVIKITPEFVFFELGGKSEGFLDAAELLDSNGEMTVQEGSTIQVYCISKGDNQVAFTTKIGGGSSTADAALAQLEEAWHSGIPVEGSVEKEIKGGFEIKLAGSVRAFCPFSQVGLSRVENPESLLGSRLELKITEFAEKGRNIIVSHRAILEEQLREKKEALKETLQEGMIVRGRVTSIRNFGAFVDIGGLEGLLPVSEISWARVEDVNDYLKPGQEVEVMITKLDWAADRFSFSLKGALPDPWESIQEKFPEGSRHSGKVVRLTNFGAFVSLADGVDGLLHISRMGRGKRVNHPREVVTLGQELTVKVLSVDAAAKRLALTFGDFEAETEEQEEKEDLTQFQKQAPASMGTLGDLLKKGMDRKKRK